MAYRTNKKGTQLLLSPLGEQCGQLKLNKVWEDAIGSWDDELFLFIWQIISKSRIYLDN